MDTSSGNSSNKRIKREGTFGEIDDLGEDWHPAKLAADALRKLSDSSPNTGTSSDSKYAEVIEREREIADAKDERDKRLRRAYEELKRNNIENRMLEVQRWNTAWDLEDVEFLAEELARCDHYQAMKLFIEVKRMEELIRECGA